jgi:hypothetical protein
MAAKIQCPDCERSFDTERGMKVHRGNVHKIYSTSLTAVGSARARKLAKKVKKVKRLPEPETVEVKAVRVSVPMHYCPQCSYDMDQVRRFTSADPHTCPACRLNLVPVAHALRPELQAAAGEDSQTFFQMISDFATSLTERMQ